MLADKVQPPAAAALAVERGMFREDISELSLQRQVSSLAGGSAKRRGGSGLPAGRLAQVAACELKDVIKGLETTFEKRCSALRAEVLSDIRRGDERITTLFDAFLERRGVSDESPRDDETQLCNGVRMNASDFRTGFGEGIKEADEDSEQKSKSKWSSLLIDFDAADLIGERDSTEGEHASVMEVASSSSPNSPRKHMGDTRSVESVAIRLARARSRTQEFKDDSEATKGTLGPVTRAVNKISSNLAKAFEGDGRKNGADDDEESSHHSPSKATDMASGSVALGSSRRSSLKSLDKRPRGKLHDFVTSLRFEAMVSAVILINCGTMGLEAHQLATNELSEVWDSCLTFSEHFFTAFFFIEFLLNLKVFGCRFFSPVTSDGRANFADAVLAIGTGVIIIWVVPFVTWLMGAGGSQGIWRSLSVLRAARLARLVRVFRKVPLFREAWLLVRGLSDSARTLIWTIIVIFFVTYTFSIFGIVLIVDQLLIAEKQITDVDERQRIEGLMNMTQGLDRMMYTLVQVLTGDSFHAFMREILVYVPWSWMYFYSYIAVASLVLMNLVTAIIVDNAMETSRSDKEQQLQEKEAARARELKDLAHLFDLIDSDGSGKISWDEFKESFDDAEMRKKWMLLDFKQQDCKELFTLLSDYDGEVSCDEFFVGLQRMKGGAQAKDLFRLEKHMDRLMSMIHGMGVAWPTNLDLDGDGGSPDVLLEGF